MYIEFIKGIYCDHQLNKYEIIQQFYTFDLNKQ